jgi:hypothetical protein
MWWSGNSKYKFQSTEYKVNTKRFQALPSCGEIFKIVATVSGGKHGDSRHRANFCGAKTAVDTRSAAELAQKWRQ